MNMRKITAVGTMAAALVGTSVTGAFAATTTPDGRPPRDPGVTVWHDPHGWHVRVTHNSVHDRVFSGEIVTRGTLVGVHAVRLERNDFVTVGAGKHSIRFRFNNYGGTDGFDFATQSAPALGFGFLADGHVVPPARISIGAAGRHPAQDPFVIRLTA